ncbi:MAG TPA: tetratricopeptide repeat protein [Fimbriimonadaceae bacterium]|nr:tetratricopeptide repeat protein [Fimbriimonadaceae bacterium]
MAQPADVIRNLLYEECYEACEAALREALAQDRGNPELQLLQARLWMLFQAEDRAFEVWRETTGSNSPDRTRLECDLREHFHARAQLARKTGSQDPIAIQRLAELPDAPTVSGSRVSACLIVKNEAKMLRRCLESLQGWIDEIVVVDTGSSDDTVAIAEACGAVVGHFEWCDDFSAARNASIELASGDWILWIDADEVVDSRSVDRIRDAIVRPQFGGYFVPIENRLGEDGSGDTYVHAPVRLFRRHPDIRFVLRIHEQIAPSIRRLGLPLAALEGAKIVHFGYAPSVMREKNKVERTIRLLEREMREQPNEPFHHFNLANALTVAGRWEQASVAARRACDRIGNDAPYASLAYHLLANALNEQGRCGEAFLACEEAATRGLDDILVSHERVRASMLLGDLEGALTESDRCLAMGWAQELTGDYGIFTHKRLILRGQVLAKLNRLEDAIREFDLALAVDPESAVTLYSKAVCLFHLGQFDDAASLFDRTANHPTCGASSDRGLAECDLRSGRAREAADRLERQWDAGRRDEGLFALWAEACERTGDSARLLHAFGELALEQDLQAVHLVNWGRALQANGDFQKALSCFAEATKRDPNCVPAYLNLGDLLYRAGQFADAAHLYESGLRLEPENADAWFTLGNCMAQLGIASGAKTAYEQVLRLLPGHAGARHNLGAIEESLQAAA